MALLVLLLEILFYAARGRAAEPLRPRALAGRALTALKAWFTVRVFWLLLAHPVKLEDGSRVVALRLIADTLAGIDAATFWTFLACGSRHQVRRHPGLDAALARAARGPGHRAALRPHLRLVPDRALHRHLPAEHRRPRRLHALRRGALQRPHASRSPRRSSWRRSSASPGSSSPTWSRCPPASGCSTRSSAKSAATSSRRSSVVPCLAIVGGLLLVLWFPGLVVWVVEHLPLPGKARLSSLVQRVSHAAAAYKQQEGLVLLALGLSFVVHFTTAVLYYFTARAISAPGAEFWPIVLASSIQILATVLSPVTIAGEGIRELAQLVLLQNLIGAGPAIVSAALGFWAAEALTLGAPGSGGRGPADYTPKWCRVDGRQVDYAEAARAAASFADAAPGAREARRGARRAALRGARAPRRRLRARRRRDRRARARPRRGARRRGRGLRQRGAGALVRAARLGRAAGAALPRGRPRARGVPDGRARDARLDARARLAAHAGADGPRGDAVPALSRRLPGAAAARARCCSAVAGAFVRARAAALLRRAARAARRGRRASRRRASRSRCSWLARARRRDRGPPRAAHAALRARARRPRPRRSRSSPT